MTAVGFVCHEIDWHDRGLATTKVLEQIRYDPVTRRGSVIDIIELATGLSKNAVKQYMLSMLESFPHLCEEISDFEFQGARERPTPIAHVDILIEIAFYCVGEYCPDEVLDPSVAVALCRETGRDVSFVHDLRESYYLEENETEEDREEVNETIRRLKKQRIQLENRLLQSQVWKEETTNRLQAAMEWKDEAMNRLQVFDAYWAKAKQIREDAALEPDVHHRMYLEDVSKNMIMTYMPLDAPGT